MNKLLIALFAALVLAGCAGPGAYELRNDGRNTDNILTYGMGYSQNRYSPLEQINKSNVKKLVPVWSLGLENDFGEQAQPLIYDGVMYVSDAKWTVAIDALTGKQLWRTAVNFEADTPRVVCCGVSNKGVALYNGKVLAHHARRACHRARPEDRPAVVAAEGCRMEGRLFADARAADCERRAGHRLFGRRIRRALFPRRLEPGHR